MVFDYVIVGAGSAGCVLAARLSEDPKIKVLLLEAGGSERTLKIRAPGLYYKLWRSAHDWHFVTEPQAHVDGRRMYWPRGKVIGGSGSLNTLLYVRGHRGDYDGWRDAGNPGWGWDDVLPLFEKSVPVLDVAHQPEVQQVSQAFAETLAKRCGVGLVDDFNRGDSEGAGLFQVTVRRGERCSSALAFLAPARSRPNLTVVSKALALGLVIDGSRVAGVRYRAGGVDETAAAGREVILCGGAIGSPHLLLRSGIGPAAQLREHGVTVELDLPGVGQNLQDHLLTFVSHDVKPGSARALTTLTGLGWLAQYLFGKRGPLSRSPVEAGGFVKIDPGAPRPDLQFHFAPYGGFEPNTDQPSPDPKGPQVMILPSLLYPKSVGEIRLASKDPMAAPVIDPRYLSDPADLALLLAGVKLGRELAATEPLAAHLVAERRPGKAAVSDDELCAVIRSNLNTIFHPVGTCKMGTGPDAVVGPDLRLRGVDGLRVADASIMPSIVGGNTNAPTIMIAEKAAELIRAAR